MTPERIAELKQALADNLIGAEMAEALAALTAAAERETALRTAGKALVDALDRCKPAIDSAFQMAWIHGARYPGTTYGVELDALRAALGLTPDPPREK